MMALELAVQHIEAPYGGSCADAVLCDFAHLKFWILHCYRCFCVLHNLGGGRI